MRISSPDFADRGKMPSVLTCDGDDVSPELSISDVPKSAKGLVLIMDDPDAPMGTWDHWIVFNMDPATTSIRKGQEPAGVGGRNSWGRAGYGGPCPPSGSHRYFFKLYALDALLPLKQGVGKQELMKAMENHIIARAELMGTYQRR